MSLFVRAALHAFILAPALAMAQECAPAGKTHITVTQDGAEALAQFEFEAAITCLRLYDRGDVRKLTWQVQTPGAVLSDDGDTVRFAEPSKTLRVKLNAFQRDGQIDRVYSPLIAFGDGKAVAVYTNYLTPESMARGVFFRFHGFSPTTPENDVGPQRLGPGATYMMVGEPTIERRGRIALVLDQAMPGWLRASVIRNITLGERALRMLKANPDPLSYLITHTELERAGMSWRGDVVDKLVRLNFMGAQWRVEDPLKQAQVAGFVLHELAHTVTSPALNPMLPGAMSLSEGAAEAAALSLSHQLGHITDAALDASIDHAMAQCQELMGGTLAEKETRSQRNAPYACGAALHFMVAKAATGRVTDALAVWTTLLRSAGVRNSGWPALLAAAGASAQADKAALATLDDMSASRIGWDEGVQKLAAGGLVRQRSAAELSQPQFAHLFTAAAIVPLLEAHCTIRYGYHDRPAAFELDAPAGSCGAVPDKFMMVALHGLRLKDFAYQAHLETARRCTARLAIEMEDDQGRKVSLPCARPVREVRVYSLK